MSKTVAALRSRRSPAPEDRLRDAERTRRALLTAALDEFSQRGFAGARVQDIADRAQVNKQLINYYFGGKDGLYQALQEEWRRRELGIAGQAAALDETAVRYLQDALDDPRMLRLMLWAGLSANLDELPKDGRRSRDITGMKTRQAKGEIAPDLDPGCALLALIALVSVPVATPQLVWQILGLDPRSPQFRRHYSEQIRLIVRQLGARTGKGK